MLLLFEQEQRGLFWLPPYFWIPSVVRTILPVVAFLGVPKKLDSYFQDGAMVSNSFFYMFFFNVFGGCDVLKEMFPSTWMSFRDDFSPFRQAQDGPHSSSIVAGAGRGPTSERATTTTTTSTRSIFVAFRCPVDPLLISHSCHLKTWWETGQRLILKFVKNWTLQSVICTATVIGIIPQMFHEVSNCLPLFPVAKKTRPGGGWGVASM